MFCPLKECENLVGEKDAIVLGEEAMEEALRDAKSLWQIRCTSPSVRQNVRFINCPMWHFPADYGLALTETKGSVQWF